MLFQFAPLSLFITAIPTFQAKRGSNTGPKQTFSILTLVRFQATSEKGLSGYIAAILSPCVREIGNTYIKLKDPGLSNIVF